MPTGSVPINAWARDPAGGRVMGPEPLSLPGIRVNCFQSWGRPFARAGRCVVFRSVDTRSALAQRLRLVSSCPPRQCAQTGHSCWAPGQSSSRLGSRRATCRRPPAARSSRRILLRAGPARREAPSGTVGTAWTCGLCDLATRPVPLIGGDPRFGGRSTERDANAIATGVTGQDEQMSF